MSDELLLAAGQLDLGLQLVLPDGPLALDGDRSPLEGRPVRLLLHLLAGGRPQRLLDLGLGSYGDDADADHRDAGLGQPSIAGQSVCDRDAHRPNATGHRRVQVNGGQQVDRVLLRRLGQQARDLVQRSAAPQTGVGVDREVDPTRCRRGVGHPVGDRRLHGDVLEVARAGVEHQRELSVVDRDLVEDRAERTEPERGADAGADRPAVPDLLDVTGA